MFAISDEEIRVAVGPFEGEEPVHEHHGGAEETEKSDPVACNDDGILQRVGDLVRRLVASDAHLLARTPRAPGYARVSLQ